MTTFEDVTYDTNHHITRESARFRDSFISEVSYKVDLALPKGDWFHGKVEVKFNLKQEVPATQSLHLDFRGNKIGSFILNSNPVEFEETKVFHEHKVILPTKNLKMGENTLSMFILNKYRKDGVGLHSFIDKVDGL